MKMNETNTKQLELQQQIATEEKALAEARSVAIKFESNAKAELANLEAQMPDLLLACVQGHGDEARKREIRNRIRELKADIAELPYLDLGFERARAKITAIENKERVCRLKLQSYEDLKERLTNDPRMLGLGTMDDLRLFAKSLDCLDDCETFIEEMQKVAA
jgi:hypothetical protein